jgi:hypothetical protein
MSAVLVCLLIGSAGKVLHWNRVESVAGISSIVFGVPLILLAALVVYQIVRGSFRRRK